MTKLVIDVTINIFNNRQTAVCYIEVEHASHVGNERSESRMQLNQLSNFLITAKLGSITKAAASVYITQPAMTKNIAALEKELGVSLFNRESKNVTVSAVGQQLLPHVQTIINEIDRIKIICERLRDDKQRITFTASVIALYITELASSFKKIRPEIDIVHQRPAPTGNDIIIDMTTEDVFSGGKTCLFHEDLVLVVPSNHYLAGRQKIDLIEIKDIPIISFAENTPSRRAEDYFCSLAGFVPHRQSEMFTHIDLFRVIEDELGVVFCPAKTGGLDGKDSNRIIRIENPNCYRYVYAQISPESANHPAVKAFFDHIVSFFAML